MANKSKSLECVRRLLITTGLRQSDLIGDVKDTHRPTVSVMRHCRKDIDIKIVESRATVRGVP
jgi:hypothetical protein